MTEEEANQQILGTLNLSDSGIDMNPDAVAPSTDGTLDITDPNAGILDGIGTDDGGLSI